MESDYVLSPEQPTRASLVYFPVIYWAIYDMPGTYKWFITCWINENLPQHDEDNEIIRNRKKFVEFLRPHPFPRLISAKVWKEGKSLRTLTLWAGSERNPRVPISEKCHLSSTQETKFFSSKTTTDPFWGCPLQSWMEGSESFTQPIRSGSQIF